MRVVRRGIWVLLSLWILGIGATTITPAVPAAGAATAPEYEFNRSFGPNGTKASEFIAPAGTAVDSQSDLVYALDRNGLEEAWLYRFDADGNPVAFAGSAPNISGSRIEDLTTNPGTGVNQVAVDSSSHEFYVTSENKIRAFDASGEAANFSAGPGAGTSEIGGFTYLSGLAVDVNGYIYASDFETDLVTVFAPSGEQVVQFASAEPGNLAVDSAGAVYVNMVGGTVRKYTPSEFPVTATTIFTPAPDPLGPTTSYTVAVDTSTDYVYVTQVFFNRMIVVYDESGDPLTTFAGPGEEGEVGIAEGIAVDKDNGRVFVANIPGINPPRHVEIFDLIVPEAPDVEFLSVSEVRTDSAILHARINPERLDTGYQFEYGPEDCSDGPDIPCTVLPLGGGEIAAGDDGVLVSEPIDGLQAGTTYHYRVVATNELGEDEEKATFITERTGSGFDLVDRRAWEMVSPPNKHGGELISAAEGVIQSSPDGEKLTYLSRGSVEAEPEGSRAPDASSVLAQRSGTSWASKDITTPNAQLGPLAQDGEYKLFTPDLSKAALEPTSGTPLSEQASERTPYLRDNTEPSSYTPLVTGKEGFENVPPGTEFGGPPAGSSPISLASGNSSLSDLVLSSGVPLATGAPQGALYRWNSGQLSLVSVLPESEGGEAIGASTLGSGQGSVQNAISEDGSRIFWTDGQYGAGGSSFDALYLRDTGAEETVRLDVPQPGASEDGAADPVFQGADPAGSIVFFTDSRQLTADASPTGRDLYRCEVSPSSGCATLTDVSAPLGGSGESAEVQGLVSGLSADATRLYFVARGVLDLDPNGIGDAAITGEPNLYFWQDGVGVRFVATLSADDAPAWGRSGLIATGPRLNTGISPDGRYLTFMSNRKITEEDEIDPSSGEPVQRVFRYDAVSDRLDCVSCNPTGAAPDGGTAGPKSLIDPRGLWGGQSVAAILPQPTTMSSGGGRPVSWRPRAVLDNGRVFFNSVEALVAADSNGEWDVYQYEPTGVGDCTASSADADTVPSAGGCVSLLSSGTGNEEAGFLDASVSGDDVFFLTPARLSVTDQDDQLDVYDARVDGVPATVSPVAECQGETCQPAVSPPADPTPGSSSFRGPGNVKPKQCPKGKRKVQKAGKVRCVPKKKKQGKQKKRAGQDRRADR